MENYMANGKEVLAEHKFSHCQALAAIDGKMAANDNASVSEKRAKRKR